jgi:hypothetical protein
MFTQNFAASGTMNIVLSQAASPGADQPFAIATTASPPNQARERIYVGVNDFATANGRTATIQQSIGPAANPSYRPARLERRSTSGQNGPQIRPAAHRDGTVYAAFYRWRSTSGNPQAGTFVVTSADVIVVRDDAGGAGANPFAGLTDPSDHLPGRRVAQGVSFQWMLNGTNATGQQRLGGCLSMAVDPRNSATAYLVYADRPQGSIHSLHLLRTIDRGQTWSHDLLRVDNATNGAVAVNSAGTIGFLYQQFQPSSGNPRWKTIFSFSQNGTNWSNIVLADCPATLPAKSFDPYIGDYDHLVAVDTQFAGVFSASNIPDHANFPSGVVFQRNADFNNKRLLRLDNTTVVRPSIDPYFFRVAL